MTSSIRLAVLLPGDVIDDIEWPALAGALGEAWPLPLIAAAAVPICTCVLRASRWVSLLAPVARVGDADLFSATMLAHSASQVVPSSGELLRPWLTSRHHPAPVATGFETIFIAGLIDLFTGLLLFVLYLFVLTRPVAKLDDRLMDAVRPGGVVAAVIAGGMLAFLPAWHANAERAMCTLERLLARAPHWLAQPTGRARRSFSPGLGVFRAGALQLTPIALQSVALRVVTALSFHLTRVAFAMRLPLQSTVLLSAFQVVHESMPTPGLVGGFHAF